MLHGKSLETDAAHKERRARRDQPPLIERISVDQRPCGRGGIDGTRRTTGEAEGMIGVGVGQHDGAGGDGVQRPQPIGAAIDHHAGAVLAQEKGTVAAVAARLWLDLAARAKKNKLDGVLPPWSGA